MKTMDEIIKERDEVCRACGLPTDLECIKERMCLCPYADADSIGWWDKGFYDCYKWLIPVASERIKELNSTMDDIRQQRDAYYDELLRLRQERVTLIEKVIWLIEDSYPDTVEWEHEELVRNINEDLVSRAKMLNEMFE